MKTSVEKLSDTRVKLNVVVPFDELSTEIDNAYHAIASQVSIPGFRKGKAPRQLIDARFGRGPILEQVINDMLPVKYQQACEENELKVIGQPQVDIKKIEDKEFVEFEAEVDVRPEIEVPDFSTFEVTVPAIKIEDAAVDADLEDLQRRFAELKDTDRELADGDVAIIDIEGEEDGEVIDYATAEGLSYTVGTDDMVPGLDEALIGLKAGDDAQFESHQGPAEDDPVMNVKVHVHQVKERVLPELTDEFAQEASEFDSIEELRNSTREKLAEAAKTTQATAIRDEVLKKALEATEFSLPESVVEEQAHQQLHALMGQLAHDETVFAKILEAQGTTREEFDAQTRQQAEESVRTQLFLDAVADQENPQVTQQELSDQILFTASSYGMDPNQFVQQLQQAGQLGNLFADVRRGKALAAAICRVTVKDEDGNSIDPSEFFGEDEEDKTDEAEA
ncbi:trigger factor [Corynebacterium uterequi]|uniref:Trigger factor n=1 Tax=Corynebacterium uterequi TaxID=1072256 RepID=A0A0G3HEB8_9CORY|nr:trigger factor [Corynebacterium uterequi]AKK11666.1 trigger factor [Corynebacterium uterequi]